MAYPDGENWRAISNPPPKGTDGLFKPGSEEHPALLGIPNVAAAAFMLKDHMDELGFT
jgi:hypothetical protein